MNRIRTLIVEDEPLAANALRRMLLDDPEIEVTGMVRDGVTALARIEGSRPDLVLLDIEVPELNGFEIIETIGVDNMPLVVFVTAYHRYTLRAFEVHALDYLLKPFEPERLSAALRHVKRQLQAHRRWQQSNLAPFLVDMAAQRTDRLAIKSGSRTLFVEASQIDYVEAAGNYARLHAGSAEYVTRETLAALEARLSAHDFVRIHRSVIVNRRRIRELRPWFTGEYIVILTSGKELTLSRGYRDRLPSLRACA